MKDKILKTKAEESYWNSDAHGCLSSKKNYVLGFIDGAKEMQYENDAYWQNIITEQHKLVDECRTKIEKQNEQLKQQLENEKQLNAEIKKRLVEVEYDCKEFNHEYCDINCKGKRKETIELYQLISDGLNETLLKQKDEENKQLAKRICELQSDLSKEKDTIDKLLDFVADRVEECDVCELADTCIREGICPFGVSHRNIKTLIKNYIRQQ